MPDKPAFTKPYLEKVIEEIRKHLFYIAEELGHGEIHIYVLGEQKRVQWECLTKYRVESDKSD